MRVRCSAGLEWSPVVGDLLTLRIVAFDVARVVMLRIVTLDVAVAAAHDVL